MARTGSRLLFSGVALLIVFAAVDAAVMSGATQQLDVAGFIALNSPRPPEIVDSLMVALTLYGREVVWGGLVIGLFFLGGEREKKAALTMGVLFLFLTGASWGLKRLDGRVRPYDAVDGARLLVPSETDSSFPSGHTIIVAGGAAVAWLSLRRRYAALLAAEASLVAFSRVYVGVHYPMDVLGGALLGAGCALVLCSQPALIDALYGKLPSQLKSRPDSLPA